MYHGSAQGVDERMINVHYYYYYLSIVCAYTFFCFFLYGALRIWLESMCHRNVHCIVRDGGGTRTTISNVHKVEVSSLQNVNDADLPRSRLIIAIIMKHFCVAHFPKKKIGLKELSNFAHPRSL